MDKKTVIKAISVTKTRESAEDTDNKSGELRPPIAYTSCLEALKNPYHQAAVYAKAEYSVGMGYDLYDREGNPSEDLKKAWDELWPDHSFQHSIDRIALDFETYANAFVEVKNIGVNPAGFPVTALYHVPAATITAKIGKDGGIEYVQKVNGQTKGMWPASDGTTPGLLHLKQYGPDGKLFGTPDWQAALNPISLDASATTFNDSFFKNNCMPQWAIVLEDASLDEGTEKAIQEFFLTNFKGLDNAHKTLLLSGGGKVTFVRLQADTKDMSFVELSNSCRDRVVAAHNIPPRLMGIVSAGSLGGAGEMQWQLRFFESGKLKKRREMYQSIFNRILKGLGAIEFTGLDLSLDTEDAAYYGTLVANDIISPATAAKELGFEPENGSMSLLANYLKK